MYPSFDRQFFESDEDFTVIGSGEVGGKALGLATAKRIICDSVAQDSFPGVVVGIPRLTVLGTDVFQDFMVQNNLYAVINEDMPDERIAHAFLKGELPPLIVGDLHALIARITTPLAVRSSSLLEDALQHPFAGVYATKMVPNNQAAIGDRFKKLTDAIKFVWASTFFQDARRYMRTIHHSVDEERMGVIIQEVVGERFNNRYYPIVSGVIRTHNYYPTGPARHEDGVVTLALGLGKTIVDGGIAWNYSPRYPRHAPPYGSIHELLRNSQTRFWAVNMEAGQFDPINEAEYLVQAGLDDAERDDVLRFTASTYDANSDRLTPGTSRLGPRALTFARMLELDDIPLNDIVLKLGDECKQALDGDVEIEFALTLDRRNGLPARFGFLQVRPMMAATEGAELTESDLHGDCVLLSTDIALGNGTNDSMVDVVYVRPTTFDAKHTREIAVEIEKLNSILVSQQRPYVLIGFGRWGSSDPWLGIPVTWPQISGARAIVEATLPEMHVDASQGSHFFHNLLSFQVQYFTVRHTGEYAIDWKWLDRRPALGETEFLRHVRLENPLQIRVDGRCGRGVVVHR
jgi:hypothetical protein